MENGMLQDKRRDCFLTTHPEIVDLGIPGEAFNEGWDRRREFRMIRRTIAEEECNFRFLSHGWVYSRIHRGGKAG